MELVDQPQSPAEKSQEMETFPSASIITVNTNERHRLEVYLPTAFASRGNFEVIISDNGSSDGSSEFLAREFPEARVHNNWKNIGFASANNRAAEIANNEILVFVNPDTAVHADWLYYLLSPFADPDIGLTTSKILLMSNPEKINTCGNTMHISGLTLCRGMGRSRRSYNVMDEVDAVSGAAFAIRREIFESLDGFDEDFFLYMEESDLSLRARLAGWKCLYVPESIVLHDYSLRFGPNKVLYQERNRYMMVLKSLKWRTLIVLLPVLLLAEVVTWGFVLIGDRKHWRNKLRAYYSIVENWNTVMRKRGAMQRLRRVSDRELLKNAGVRLDFSQAAKGGVSLLATIVFTPLFFTMKCIARAIVWW
jgi:GT2 family glycosyltransferase